MSLRNRGKIRKILRGKKVLLVGSAPGTAIPDSKSYDVIATANSSAGSLAKFGLAPEVTFITSSLLSDKIDPAVLDQSLKMVSLTSPPEILISIRNGFHFEAERNVFRFGIHVKDLLVVKLGEMRRIAIRLTKSQTACAAPNALPSTGVLAVLLCFYFGATSVVLTGFGLTIAQKTKSGTLHYYETQMKDSRESDRSMRAHSSADALVLASLSARGYKISSDSLEINSLLENWAGNAPTFYKNNFLTRLFWSKFAPW